jgi:glycosyltransferase involved in cell wall biosynthesis
LLRHLLDAGAGAAVYLDPDTKVFAPLSGLDDLAAAHDVVLTPHLLQPFVPDGLGIDELTILRAGAFNLGFVAVGARGLPFLDFWAERLRRWAVVAPEEGLFTDQRWVDFAPALFDVHVIRDAGWNAAYWNLHERPLAVRPDARLEVGGRPLTFFHFSGHDPLDGALLSRHQGANPRHLLSRNQVLADLCTGWRADVLARGHEQRATLPYALDATPRFAVTPDVRRVYRDAVLRAEAAGVQPPPPPLGDDGGAAFLRWCHEPDPVASGDGVVVTRLVEGLWRRRPDLRQAFPHVPGRHAADLARWAAHDVDLRTHVDERLLPGAFDDLVASRTRDLRRASPRPGWNVVGYLDSELGVGESGRLVVLAAERAGIPVATTVDGTTSSRRQHGFARRGRSSLPYDTNIMCVNGDRLRDGIDRIGPDAAAGRRTVGLWYWEVDVITDVMRDAAPLADELWAASTYVQRILEHALDLPVRHFPLPVVRPSSPSRLTRADLGWPEDRFVVLLTFDFLSVIARKNPAGLLDAYRRAFAPSDGATLVLKSINGNARIADLERLRAVAADRPDVVIDDRYVPAGHVGAMTERCDVYASLHRAEGFGLGIAHAMAAGKPVVATNWSGNVDFMDETCARPVPYDLVPVGHGAHPYPASATWAEPDLDAAAAALRSLFDDRALGARLGAAAQRRMAEHHGLDVAAAFVREHFARRVVAA